MDRTKIGLNIQKLRENNGWSQKYLAYKLNLTQSAVSQYEKGVRIPEDLIKKKIANEFGVSVDSIFFG